MGWLMEPIALVRSFYLNSMTELLERHGAPVYKELDTYKLPALDREENDLLIPLWTMSKFYAEASVRAGVPNPAYNLAIHLDATGLSSAFIARAQAAPSLRIALREFCRLVPREDNRVRFWIERYGEVTRIYSTLVGASQEVHPEASYWVQNLMVVSLVRQFVSEAWQPMSIAFSNELYFDEDVRSAWPSTRFVAGAGSCWVDIPTSAMAMGVRRGSQLMNTVPEVDASYQPHNLVHSVEALLRAYVGKADLSVGEIADFAGLSVRTLQRRLRDDGFSIKELTNRARFVKARDLLRETNAPVRDIAFEVGYSYPSHFTRAFRHMAGMTPREYRAGLDHRVSR